MPPIGAPSKMPPIGAPSKMQWRWRRMSSMVQKHEMKVIGHVCLFCSPQKQAKFEHADRVASDKTQEDIDAGESEPDKMQ
mmetsp:Transcript_16073/g.17545  ORF Transcript_16073/g.17545 Transcript_16073/m.17545 type:complete len:80 (-) Transcript_16073:182-421(-)